MSVVYTKAKPAYVPPHQTRVQKTHIHRFVNILPAVLVTFGSVLIANVLWPILSFQIFTSPLLQTPTFVAPVAEEQMVQYQPAVLPVKAAEETQNLPTPTPTILDGELDYTNLALWFPSQHLQDFKEQEAKSYSLTIPELDIENAVVKIGGLNLDKNLIQYPGTANPGELGSPIIFGHSVSPLFYNPSINNSKRYTSIFTKIMTLKKDDKIIVNYDGITYTYRVTNKIEVKPDDTYILEQRYDVRELKLVTCTPPGTYLRRGIVFAQLEDFE
ncbi:MAG: sortase [Candidatus Pacebacteria bacterium]|nr:sortase [Candidatus Paceibacterota bacterium]